MFLLALPFFSKFERRLGKELFTFWISHLSKCNDWGFILYLLSTLNYNVYYNGVRLKNLLLYKTTENLIWLGQLRRVLTLTLMYPCCPILTCCVQTLEILSNPLNIYLVQITIYMKLLPKDQESETVPSMVCTKRESNM